MESKSHLPPERWSEIRQSTRRSATHPKADSPQDIPGSLSRYAGHLAALLIIALVIFIARVEWKPTPTKTPAPAPQKDASRPVASSRDGSRLTSENALAQIQTLRIQGVLATKPGERPSLTPSPAEHAPQVTPSPVVAEYMGIGGPAFELSNPSPEPTAQTVVRTEVITYVVQPGDMVGTIARKFGIDEATVCAANGRLADNPDYLRVGQVLFILPVSGVLHVVEKGDTLEDIAKQYKANVEDIIAFKGNGLSAAPILVEGQELIVPNGKKPPTVRMVVAWRGTIPKGAKRGSGSFVWPTTGVITQKYWSQHQAIDIGWVEGTGVIAADSGYVVQVGFHEGYGRFVLIDHGNGFQTLYAHFQMYFVEEGQSVAKGETIGLMGNTGRSTGPHLHFEIRKNGVKVNPLIYLP